MGALLRWLGWRTITTFVLCWLALASVAFQIAQSIGRLDLWLLLQMLTLAMACGWLAARTRLGKGTAVLGIAVVGVMVIALIVGQLGGRLVTLALALGELQVPATALAGLGHTAKALTELTAALMVLAARLWEWSLSRFGGQLANDPVATALAWSGTFWVLGAWAAWNIRRRSEVAHALAPTVLVLLVNLFLLGVFPTALLVVLLCALLLQPLVGHHAREKQWATTGVDYSEDIRLDIALTIVPLATVLVVMTLFLSSLSLSSVIGAVRDALAGSGTVAVSSGGSSGPVVPLEPPPPDQFEGVRSAGLPRHHLIGSGPELTKQIVMTITLSGELPAGVPRPYWRSLVYDRYTGHGWASSPTEGLTLRVGSTLQEEPADNQFALEQSVQSTTGTSGLLFNAGQFVSANHDVQVARWPDGDVFGALINSPVYGVHSYLTVVSEGVLRASGTQYPDAVRAQYLDLPEDVPARVLALARDLTATEPTPFDRARAIERYLRTYSYTLALPEPPASRDVADYFLFDLKKGYCDYYATAMVVLARAAGLPARLVVGYAAGGHALGSAQYVVTQADAHSWPEVYFEGSGWIGFEPTAGQPALERPGDATDLPPLGPRLPAGLAPVSIPGIVIGIAALLAGLGILLAAGYGVGTVVDDWQMRRLPARAFTARVYERLRHEARKIGVPMRSSDTPYEWLAMFSDRVEEIELNGPVARRKTLVDAAHNLADLYVDVTFSRHTVSERERSRALANWQRAQPILSRSVWALRFRRVARAVGRRGV